MSKIHKLITKISLLGGAILISGICVTGSMAQTLTDSTSVTIVNVTTIYRGGVDVTTWSGAWPNSPDNGIIPLGMNVYMNNVHYERHHMSWNTTPSRRPYPVFPNTISNMIAAVFSRDGGRTYTLQSWDYLQASTSGKGTEGGMPSCWMGAMVHSLCDRKPGECNGRYRSNLYFSEWPAGNTRCWASANPQ